nr:hypothetical protein [uncultured Enterobacter sp.]
MSKEVTSNIAVKRVKASSIYRLLLIGLGVPFGLMSVLFSLLACFGYDTVAWNDKHIHGLLALPVGLFSGLMMTVIFTALLGTICCLGLWIYSRFRPLEIRVIE